MVSPLYLPLLHRAECGRSLAAVAAREVVERVEAGAEKED
jgi:hypothetical protein